MEGEAHSRPSQAGSPGGIHLEGDVVQQFPSVSFSRLISRAQDLPGKFTARNSLFCHGGSRVWSFVSAACG